MKCYQKIGKKIIIIVGSFCCSVLAIIIFSSMRNNNEVEPGGVRNLRVWQIVTSPKLSHDRVKINRYMHEVKCKDTVWTNDIYVDSSYSVWLKPLTHVYPEYFSYYRIKIIRHEDSTFTVDATKCGNDYEWIMYDNTDFGLQGYYPVSRPRLSDR